jgi:demethylmenaquinone methyltransferase/2-methoxy-6-polyprenyl-1,4-benzoquinol methylase
MENSSMQAQVSQMFNAIAKRYDRVNRILSFGIDRLWRSQLKQHLPEENNLHLLDLATGTCDQLLALMGTEKIEKAVGIDLAQEMLLIGQKKISASPYSQKISLQCASALSIPFSKPSFDCITISFGIRNVQGNCLKEIYRVLKPKGRALILEFSLPKNRVIRGAHLLYLRKILPFVGGLFTKKTSAYRYLNQTIESFPYGEKFLTLMENEGFIHCKAIPLTFGIATLYIGDKP